MVTGILGTTKGGRGPRRSNFSIDDIPDGNPYNASSSGGSSTPSAPFFLASAPVSDLARARALVESRGGEYAAGDRDDIL